MIENGKNIPSGATMECDYAIVGGGAAGITLALELAASGKRIVLLESGGKRETARARDLNRGFIAPESSHEPLEDYRRRQFGGATSAWGGRCIPFDEIDFEERDWVPHSGWPFSRSELDAFYPRAVELCDAGDYLYRAEEVFPEKQREIIPGFDDREVTSNHLERWGPPVHFGKRYEKDLRARSNVTVLLHANCLHVQLDSGGAKVESITAATEPHRPFTIKSGTFIIASGCLETTRLLLVSNDIKKAGIGNHSDQLGRFYMSHLLSTFAVATIRDPNRNFIYDFEKDRHGVYCRRRFWITLEVQRERKILNAIAFSFRPNLGDAQHRSALLSAAYLSKLAMRAARKHSPDEALGYLRARNVSAHMKNLLIGAPTLAPQLMSLVKNRFLAERRLPFVLPPPGANRFSLFYQTEQAPHPESRVSLHADKDAFGMPRLLVDIKFSEIDVTTVVELHRILRRRFEETHVGDLIYDEQALIEHVRHELGHFDSSSHHIGTTRMSVDPAEGVVDANCRVHGVRNLFLASSSTFPTGSHANPTLTIVAVAVRLAEFLKKAAV